MGDFKTPALQVRRALAGVVWHFSGSPFASSAEFAEAVAAEQARHGSLHAWHPGEILLRHPRGRIRYTLWQRGQDIERSVELASEHGQHFTVAEMLFLVHNALVTDRTDALNRDLDGVLLCELEGGAQCETCVLCLGPGTSDAAVKAGD